MDVAMSEADQGAASFREELVRQDTRRQNHEAVRQNLVQVVSLFMQQCGRCWCFLVLSLIPLGVFLVAQSESVLENYENHTSIGCQTPLPFMLRGLYIILLLNVFQKEIIRCFCCYDFHQEPDEPLRIRLFKRFNITVALLWPLVGGVMLLMTPANSCDPDLISAMHVLLLYYLTVFIVGLVLPTFTITAMLCLIRRGWIRAPRSRDAAPEGLIEELPTLTFDPEIFVDGREGCYPAACSICLEDFSGDKSITKTPCDQGVKHAFHTECLKGWLQVARTCPLCRVDLTASAA